LPTLYGGDYVSSWPTLTELVAEGLIRSAGVSTFPPAHLDRLVTGIAPIVNQVDLHPILQLPGPRGLLAAWDRPEAHSPLGHNREPLIDDTIGRAAEAYGKSPAR
jgi:2,5-diketo-D-gluconate reductase A